MKPFHILILALSNQSSFLSNFNLTLYFEDLVEAEASLCYQFFTLLRACPTANVVYCTVNDELVVKGLTAMKSSRGSCLGSRCKAGTSPAGTLSGKTNCSNLMSC